jgi:hypothetical protein
MLIIMKIISDCFRSNVQNLIFRMVVLKKKKKFFFRWRHVQTAQYGMFLQQFSVILDVKTVILW